MKHYTKKILILLLILIVFTAYKLYEHFQTQDCSTITNCKACTNSFGCLWCVKSKKCVSDLSNNVLCAQESTIVDPMSCDETPEDISGSSLTGGECSINRDCKSCLTSPGCFWCANKEICSSNEKVYSDCIDDPSLYNSIEQCNLKKSIEMNYPQTDSVIPVLGLSRDMNGRLTDQSLKIVFDSFASRGTAITDSQSKENALQMIDNEKTFYSNKSKAYTESNSSDEAQKIQSHIQDLDDISRYIENYNTTNYVEGFQVNEAKFEYTLQENKGMNSKIQLLWLGNLIAIGTLFYLMR